MKNKDFSLIIISSLLISVLKYVFGEEMSIKYGETLFLIFIAVILFSLFNLTRESYSNMSTFYFLTFMLIGLLPYFHYLNYSYDKENYSFNKEYLDRNIKNYKEELKNYKDSVSILDLQTKFHNVKINLLEEKKQKIKEYTFIVKSISKDDERPNDRSREKEVDIFKNNIRITTVKLESGNLIDGINKFTREMNLLKTKIQNPKQFIPYNDIWLDSVTGFIFGFLKPLSKLSQIIRFLQLITAYLLFHMISSWLKTSKILNISEIGK
jgi:hypothetical protein